MSDTRVSDRQRRAAKAWGLSSEIVVVGAGTPISIPGGWNMCFPYREHPHYRWLTERKREGGVVAFDPGEGWTLFEPPITELELVWGGGDPPIGRPIEELKDWLAKRSGRPIANLGVKVEGVESNNDLAQRLELELDHARRKKDSFEIDLIKRAAAATARAYEHIAGMMHPGMTERQVQVEFDYALTQNGSEGPGYPTIVASGPNSAVFHFSPGAREFQPGELVVVDAGGEVDEYTVDVTRTYAVGGSFDVDQRAIYDAVLDGQRKAISNCRAGVEYLDMQKSGALAMAGHLQELGFLRCSPEEAFDKEILKLFFPHGIGHPVGLGVRDSGGFDPERYMARKSAGEKQKMDFILEPGVVITIEPGLYFIPALFKKAENRDKYAKEIGWNEVDRWVGHGGIRLEDNILVTEGEPTVLTADIPK